MNSLYWVELDVRGHQDDAVGLGRMPAADLLVECDPVHAGHPHIAEDNVIGPLGEPIESRLAVAHSINLVAGLLDDPRITSSRSASSPASVSRVLSPLSSRKGSWTASTRPWIREAIREMFALAGHDDQHDQEAADGDAEQDPQQSPDHGRVIERCPPVASGSHSFG